MVKSLKFIDFREAISRLTTEVSLRIDGEIVDLLDAVGRYSFKDYVSKADLPPFNRSAVDGIAAKFSDVVGASESSPVVLRLVGSVDVDNTELPSLREFEAVLVSTGAPVPREADVVIPLEHCLVKGNHVLVYKTYPRYANISLRGEDIRTGELIVRRGTRLRPWHVAALAASGYEKIEVFRRIRVAIINTGDEILRGLVPNTTYYVIASYVREVGGEVALSRTVPDDVGRISEALREALATSDVVVITGGTSVGSRDLVPEAILRLEDSREVFHGVKIRPGRTAGVYLVGGKPVLALSGLPVAAYICLDLFLGSLLAKLYGFQPEFKPSVKGKLVRRLPNEVGFRSFYRVVVCEEDGEVLVVPLKLTGSGLISTLIKGNAILEVPEELEGLEEGSEVTVTLLNPVIKCSEVPQSAVK